jgi:hypothetical protein
MGLDMFLTGKRKYRIARRDHKKIEEYEIGYWHNHWSLCHYIIKNFFSNNEDQYGGELMAVELKQILEGVKNDLIVREGTYHGSIENDKYDDIEILTKAINWLETEDLEAERQIFFEYSY